MLHLSQRIGIADYRDLQCAFVTEHKDPEGLPIYTPDSAEDLQRGHSSSMAQERYGLATHVPRDTSKQAIKAYRRTSAWWQHITGKQTIIFVGLAHI